MVGYFNDITGCIALSAYINLISSFGRYKIAKLREILGIIFLAGLFWEFITPLYRADTVTDILDIFAYFIGGIIYYMLIYFTKEEQMK